MAKLSIDQRIQRVNENIEKEEKNIVISKDKIKAFLKQLKVLNQEKDNKYANNFLNILSENGFTSDEDKTQFMQMIKEQLKKPKA